MVFADFLDEGFTLYCDFCFFECPTRYVRSTKGEDICFSCFYNSHVLENSRFIIFIDAQKNLIENVLLENLLQTNNFSVVFKTMKKYYENKYKICEKFHFLLENFKYEKKPIIETEKSLPFDLQIPFYAPKRNEFEFPEYLKAQLEMNMYKKDFEPADCEVDLLNCIADSLKKVVNHHLLQTKMIMGRNLLEIKRIRRHVSRLNEADLNTFQVISPLLSLVEVDQFELIFREFRKENSLLKKMKKVESREKQKSKIAKRICKIEKMFCEKIHLKTSIYFEIKSRVVIENIHRGINFQRFLNFFESYENEEQLLLIFKFFQINKWI